MDENIKTKVEEPVIEPKPEGQGGATKTAEEMYAELLAENKRMKKAFDKASSEAADYKKQQPSLMPKNCLSKRLREMPLSRKNLRCSAGNPKSINMPSPLWLVDTPRRWQPKPLKHSIPAIRMNCFASKNSTLITWRSRFVLTS